MDGVAKEKQPVEYAYMPGRKRGPLAKKLEENLRFLDLNTVAGNTTKANPNLHTTFLNSPDRTGRSHFSKKADRNEEFHQRFVESRMKRLSEKWKSNISFLDIETVKNDDWHSRQKKVKSRHSNTLSKKLKQNLQYLDISPSIDIAEKTKLGNKSMDKIAQSPEFTRRYCKNICSGMFQEQIVQKSAHATDSLSNDRRNSTQEYIQKSKYDSLHNVKYEMPNCHEKYEPDSEDYMQTDRNLKERNALQNETAEDYELRPAWENTFEDIQFMPAFDEEALKPNSKKSFNSQLNRQPTQPDRMSDKTTRLKSIDKKQSTDKMFVCYNTKPYENGNPITFDNILVTDRKKTNIYADIKDENQQNTTYQTDQGSLHSDNISAKKPAINGPLNIQVGLNTAVKGLEQKNRSELKDVDEDKLHGIRRKPSAATLEALRSKLLSVNDKRSVTDTDSSQKVEIVNLQIKVPKESIRPTVKTRSRILLSKPCKKGNLRNAPRKSTSVGSIRKAVNIQKVNKTRHKHVASVSKRKTRNTKRNSIVNQKKAIIVSNTVPNEQGNKTMWLIDYETRTFNEIQSPCKDIDMLAEKTVCNPLAMTSILSNADRSDCFNHASPEYNGEWKSESDHADSASCVGYKWTNTEKQHFLSHDSIEAFNNLEIQTCRKMEELDNSLLSKIAAGKEVTELELAMLVASETASMHLKESVMANGDTLYYFPMNKAEMEEESLWIITHALLRMLGATEILYSRLFAIVQKTAFDASTILRAFLDLLCKEICGRDATFLPDVLKTVCDICQQLKYCGPTEADFSEESLES